MMNSRWQANKIGLINFWYYDEQEFPFVKGRMLLRGSNGSGKSVTMQSVVPLLLDGNMSPERLDPFGSRDRKMSSYLLEEDDGREERTGYLYLELKRQNSDTYLTIGMGIRARRGKNLDKWYFSLTDGRRIGKDFFLYKDSGEKVTLSKKELENRIGDGGRVIDRQVDYMEYVNRQIFGFETTEEYKEMIDLLIQLRTPKLSKDFKPSVINDILSDSLQPLSDDDLRPMSEAIENMDTMTMNLKNRKEARQAAEKIQAVFSKYNQKLLYEKAERCEQAGLKLENARTQQKEQEKNELFTEEEQTEFPAKRLDISARYQGVKISFASLLLHLEEDITELENLIKDGDRELFEDILANTVSRKIRGKINGSNTWVQKMNSLMNGMNTSSGLKLSLRWRSKTAEQEDQLDTKELVELLKKDYRLMSEDEAARLSAHFRSKVAEARRNAKDSAGMISFYQIMKDTLDYRKWFEFQLFSQKNGERQKELTNSVFGTFSGGEKAMSMYVPLFSAVVAKYQGGREDAPRLISLDEAFAGVDNKNIRDMFRLMTEFRFDFIINSQVLWGDCDTLDALAIYQLIRPGNAKFVTVMPYLWNGHRKELLEHEEEVEQRGIELGQAEGV